MANFKIEGGNIQIGGDITLICGEALLNFLRNTNHSLDTMNVDLKSVSRWDSSAVQLFVSWLKTLRGSTQVSWRNVPEEMAEDIRLMGLSNLFNGVNDE